MSVAVVRAYNEAWAAGDLTTARGLLADDLQFHGPIDTFTNAEDMVTALASLAKITTGIHWHTLFAAEGDPTNVAAFYRLDTAVGPLECAEWHLVSGGLIRLIELRFDPRPLLTFGPD
jgi:hypothetical protein